MKVLRRFQKKKIVKVERENRGIFKLTVIIRCCPQELNGRYRKNWIHKETLVVDTDVDLSLERLNPIYCIKSNT